METKERFPVGGAKQDVYDFLRSYGFTMSKWSDKHWERKDGMQVHIYGTGSMARVLDKDGGIFADGPIAEAMLGV